MSNNILSLDISLNCTGYSIFDDNFNLISFGTIEPIEEHLTGVSKNLTYHVKAKNQLKEISSLVEKFFIGRVSIERFSFGSFGKSDSITAIVETTGLIKNYLFEKNIPYVLISPQSAKKKITGSGRGTKDDVYNVLIKKYPSILNCKRDISDSISIAICAFYLGDYVCE